ncbi:MAG: hypothetical protein ACP5N2_06230 [Candidatus Nanoarchaeia archaeon]
MYDLQFISSLITSNLKPYLHNQKYGNLRPVQIAIDWNEEILWTYYYDEPELGSTRPVNFNYNSTLDRFEITGKKTTWYYSGQTTTTKDLNEAIKLLEERVKDIPLEFQKIKIPTN